MELVYRPRRLRRTAAIRRMVRETVLNPADFIYPMFVAPGKGLRQEVEAMPGVARLSVDLLVEAVKPVWEAGAAGGAAVRPPAEKGRHRQRGRLAPRARCNRRCGPEKGSPGAGGHHRRLPVRLYQPRPLRPHPPRRHRQRCDASRSWPRWPCPTPRPAPTWWPPRT